MSDIDKLKEALKAKALEALDIDPKKHPEHHHGLTDAECRIIDRAGNSQRSLPTAGAELTASDPPASRRWVIAEAPEDDRGDPAVRLKDQRVKLGHSAAWSAQVVRARFIEWLCRHAHETGHLFSGEGMVIDDACILGLPYNQYAAHVEDQMQMGIDLAGAEIPFALRFMGCHVPGGVRLTSASTRSITFEGCTLGPIVAAGCRIRGSMVLKHRQEATKPGATEPILNSPTRVLGGVTLYGAEITRDLVAEGAAVIAASYLTEDRERYGFEAASLIKNVAINADGLRASNVLLQDGFLALGEVRLTTARISSDAHFDRARIVNPSGQAIDARGLSVGGNLTCRDESLFYGGIDLSEAVIRGNLKLGWATLFLAPDVDAPGTPRISDQEILEHALSANGITVHGSVDLHRSAKRRKFFESTTKRAHVTVPRNSVLDDTCVKVTQSLKAHVEQAMHTLLERGGLGDRQRAPLLDELLKLPPHKLPFRSLFVGQVTFVSARFHSDVDCLGSKVIYERPNHPPAEGGQTRAPAAEAALRFDRAQIDGTLFTNARLTPNDPATPFFAVGGVDLGLARIKCIFDSPECWPCHGQLGLGGCIYDMLDQDIRQPESPRQKASWLSLRRPAIGLAISRLFGEPRAGTRADWLSRQSGHSWGQRIGNWEEPAPHPSEQAERVLRESGSQEWRSVAMWHSIRRLRSQLARGLAPFANRRMFFGLSLFVIAVVINFAWPHLAALNAFLSTQLGPAAPRALYWGVLVATLGVGLFFALPVLRGVAALMSLIVQCLVFIPVMWQIGYGLNVRRAVLVWFLLITVSTTYFGAGRQQSLVTGPADWMVPSNEFVILSEQYRKNGSIPPDYPDFMPCLFAIDAAVPIVNLHQESYWIPASERGPTYNIAGYQVTAGKIGKLWLVVHTILGWVLSTAILVGLTGLLHPDHKHKH